MRKNIRVQTHTQKDILKLLSICINRYFFKQLKRYQLTTKRRVEERGDLRFDKNEDVKRTFKRVQNLTRIVRTGYHALDICCHIFKCTKSIQCFYYVYIFLINLLLDHLYFSPHLFQPLLDLDRHNRNM